MKRRFAIFTSMVIIFTININLTAEDSPCNRNNVDYAKDLKRAGRLYYTSILIEGKNKDKYSPGKAFDGNPGTAWVEGKADEGIGEKIAFPVIISKDSGIKIDIMPGFGHKKYFKLNNRVKKARLTFLQASHCSDFKGPDMGITKLYDILDIYDKKYQKVKFMNINFEDEMRLQSFNISIPPKIGGFDNTSYAKNHRIVYCVLEILEVYRGSKWNDTCISQINVWPQNVTVTKPKTFHLSLNKNGSVNEAREVAEQCRPKFISGSWKKNNFMGITLSIQYRVNSCPEMGFNPPDMGNHRKVYEIGLY